MPGGLRLTIHYKKIVIVILVLLFLSLALFYLYVQIQTYPAETSLLEQIEGNDGLTIQDKGNYLILSPQSIDGEKKSIIYYPGGLVAPEAYLYKMGHTAICLEKTVYIIRAPFNAAIFRVNAARSIIHHYELGPVWVGGHSLGGISAARFAAGHREMVSGVFLFGSYSDRDLGDFEGRIVSVMGLQDQIINWDNYEQAKKNLPPDAILLEIQGLNHSDFGSYGLQRGDGMSLLNEKQIIEIICSIFHDTYSADDSTDGREEW